MRMALLRLLITMISLRCILRIVILNRIILSITIIPTLLIIIHRLLLLPTRLKAVLHDPGAALQQHHAPLVLIAVAQDCLELVELLGALSSPSLFWTPLDWDTRGSS